MKKENQVLKQDLTQEEKLAGSVFIIHLLMEEKCPMPTKEILQATLQKHLGEVEGLMYSKELSSFFAKKYITYFGEDKSKFHPQLMITGCSEIEKPIMDEVAQTQLWDCPNGNEILENCKYQVIATDMLASRLDYKQRAEMLVAYTEALVELFPTCKAVVFENSKKMFTREDILHCDLPKELRFIYYAVNVRSFDIEGTNDMMVDTLGMSALFLPDLQYHFHSLNTDDVANHAYDMLSYIYEHNNPIKDGDTIAGLLSDGQMWKVQYEEALIQPVREVIDINMGEFAAGDRG